MNRFLLGLAAFLVGGLLAYWMVGGMDVKPRKKHPTAVKIKTDEAPKVYNVTPEMERHFTDLKGQPAPELSLPDARGSLHTLNDFDRTKPIVLVFMGKDDPNTLNALPFIERIRQQYMLSSNFVGILNADVASTAKWVKENRPSFLILSDKNLKTMKDYRITNAASLVVISKDKKIALALPGYSVELFSKLNSTLAMLCGSEAKILDLTGLPNDPVTGEPYETKTQAQPGQP